MIHDGHGLPKSLEKGFNYPVTSSYQSMAISPAAPLSFTFIGHIKTLYYERARYGFLQKKGKIWSLTKTLY